MRKIVVLIMSVGILTLCGYAIYSALNYVPAVKYVPARFVPVERNVPAVNNIPGAGNKVVYSDYLTSGTGDEYCASLGLICTNLMSCQLDKGGCNPSEYCGDPRFPSCPCTVRCASSPNISDDEGRCGACRWVDIACSNYGGVWTGPEVSCDPEHAGVVVMKHHNNKCGAQHLEAYTTERWNTCFTPRAQCVCN